MNSIGSSTASPSTMPPAGEFDDRTCGTVPEVEGDDLSALTDEEIVDRMEERVFQPVREQAREHERTEQTISSIIRDNAELIRLARDRFSVPGQRIPKTHQLSYTTWIKKNLGCDPSLVRRILRDLHDIGAAPAPKPDSKKHRSGQQDVRPFENESEAWLFGQHSFEIVSLLVDSQELSDERLKTATKLAQELMEAGAAKRLDTLRLPAPTSSVSIEEKQAELRRYISNFPPDRCAAVALRFMRDLDKEFCGGKCIKKNPQKEEDSASPSGRTDQRHESETGKPVSDEEPVLEVVVEKAEPKTVTIKSVVLERPEPEVVNVHVTELERPEPKVVNVRVKTVKPDAVRRRQARSV